jgi:hypothetical protein
MKIKELVVVPHPEGLLIVCYANGTKTEQILLTKEQAVFLANELRNSLYKMGYKPPADPVAELSHTG